MGPRWSWTSAQPLPFPPGTQLVVLELLHIQPASALSLLAEGLRKWPCRDPWGGWRVGRWTGSSPDILPIEQAEEAECHHVPVGAVVIAHQVQSQRHVRVAVVTAEVVLEMQEGWYQAGLWENLPPWFPPWFPACAAHLPCGACTPPRHHAQLCPMHWAC